MQQFLDEIAPIMKGTCAEDITMSVGDIIRRNTRDEASA
jgi:hypothetical protein